MRYWGNFLSSVLHKMYHEIWKQAGAELGKDQIQSELCFFVFFCHFLFTDEDVSS